MTERLYYHDSRLTQFSATVLEVQDGEDIARVHLDRSAFYPESGGQPADRGRLGSADVVDVLLVDGDVWHEVAPGSRLPNVGEVVTGVIDWERRYDLMQQHSGQHLLSQVFVRLFGWETLSVHMGLHENTLDLETPSVTQAELDAAEAEANRLVRAALPVKVYFVESSEIDTVPLRRAPKVTGTVRIVEIEGFDWSACGGTHVATTAELSPILITHSERRRGGVRVTFLCGERALREIVRTRSLLSEAAALFSTDVDEVPLLIVRTQEKVKEMQRVNDALRERLLGIEAERLLLAAGQIGDLRIVVVQRGDLDAADVRLLASMLAAQPQVVALIASEKEGKALLAFARNAETTPASLHMGNLLRDALAQAGGKGGGHPDFAQGGGVPAEETERLLAWARGQVF